MEILVYALIALVIAYRLYNTFGQRGEGEPQRRNPFVDDKKDNVLPLPTRLLTTQGLAVAPQNPLANNPNAPAPNSLSGALFAIRNLDPSFDEKSFLKGARLAFEVIVHGFAAGERGTLRNLTSPSLYKAFDDAVCARELQGQRVDIKILHLRDAEITAAQLDGNMATITVQFVSDQHKITYDRDGHAGEDTGVQQLTDVWSFTRDVKSPNPNWQLTSTRT